MSICPYCKSPNTQKLSVMHQGGISTGTAVGVGVSSGGLGAGVGINKQQTQLSKAAAPPPSKNFGIQCFSTGCVFIPVGLFASIIAGNLAGMYLVLAVTAIIWSLPFLLRDYTKQSAAADADAQTKWDSSAMCLSCGKTFSI